MPQFSFQIEYQLSRLEKQFREQIKTIKEAFPHRDREKLYKDKFLRTLLDLKYDSYKIGNNTILPYYYILTKNYNMAWILFNYLNIRFGSPNEEYNAHAKHELEDQVDWDMRPLWFRDHEDTIMPDDNGSTCFRLFVKNYGQSMLEEKKNGTEEIPPYDIAPEARYKTIKHDETQRKLYHLSWETLYTVLRLLEVYFRQEKHAETEECLLRLRHIVIGGVKPKDLLEIPSPKMVGPYLFMYEAWNEARLEEDPTRRQELAWNAFYWFLERGLNLIGSNRSMLQHFSDGCEILGEFELLGPEHEEFLRHLKRFVMHASVSYCKKMLDNPIQIVPFAERDMPDYEEFKKYMTTFL